MPSARTPMTTRVNPGDRESRRSAYLRSARSESMAFGRRGSRTVSRRLRRDIVGGFVPVHGLFPEIRFVRHVASNGGVIAEHRVLHRRFAGAHGLEEIIQVRF